MIRAQLEPADILVLNKADLASPEESDDAARRFALLGVHAEILKSSASQGAGMDELVERVWRWWA